MKLLGLLRRARNMPMDVVARRAWREVGAELDATLRTTSRTHGTAAALLRGTGASSVAELWERCGRAPFPSPSSVAAVELDTVCPGSVQRLRALADEALRHEVDLLGARVSLGAEIDWHRDYVSGFRWPPVSYRRLDVHGFDAPSDVKFPWEVSRFQWVLPLAQTYRLTGDDRLASEARRLIESWIDANPYATGVNWACAMDVAIRLAVWTWLFRAFWQSEAWADAPFQERFLRSMFVQARFVERNLEESDLNSNHYLADAAGLVFAGLFFSGGPTPRRWSELGWAILMKEAPLQVLPDGVDYEGSVSYHRLVLELLFFPALYRKTLGLEVPRDYWDRLVGMAKFVAAYSDPRGECPLVGDADDGRLLPLGTQTIRDHRYLIGLVGVAADDRPLCDASSGALDEVYWWLGESACAALRGAAGLPTVGAAFRDSGFYVMRHSRGHVFIDGGPVGLAGRGGHGHNDCLSFEATLNGVRLVTDSGTSTYTRAPSERDRFRATEAHNTPRVDRRELNRFVGPRMLWALRFDARPEILEWRCGANQTRFRARHSGYRRLPEPVMVTRTISLEHRSSVLAVRDEISGSGRHYVEVPLHLAPGVEVVGVEPGRIRLAAEGRSFFILWSGDPVWRCEVASSFVSASYGVREIRSCLRWSAASEVPLNLSYAIAPEAPEAECDWQRWLNVR